ncbi:uhpb [Bifidobacterium minimum]|uniref:Uhpb n=2 Tax=Bifidobacterium minimum TaxID=1693 RepID=A0A087BLP1_9BIFI|nr:uhpb [Bifidobacterium minimum]
MPIVTDLYNLVFFNRAFPLIFLLVSLGIAITRKFARSFMLITLPLIAVMASLLLFSPVSSFRYAIQIYYSIPLIIIWMIFRMNQSKRGGRLVY